MEQIQSRADLKRNTMPDKHRRKVPGRPEKRHPKQKRHISPPDIPAWSPADVQWLPSANADYTVWMTAAERASREHRIAWKEYIANDNRREEYEHARSLLIYTLARAFPPGFSEGLVGLMAGKTENVEIYIRFLELDPYFFGSGYAKAYLIRYLKWLPFTTSQQRRLQDVVLNVVKKGCRREFRSYCHWARYVQTPAWLQEVEAQLASWDPNLALRAQWILQACRQR